MRRWYWLVPGVFAGTWALFSMAALLVDAPSPELLRGVGNSTVHELLTDDEDPWSVLVLADVQDGFHYLPEIFRRGRRFDPAAIIILGDLSERCDARHMQLPVREIQRHTPPATLFVIPGNHDIQGEEGVAEFIQWFGGMSFDFRIGRTRFLGLNNADGPLSVEALEQLKRRLDEADALGERVIVCLHRNVVEAGDGQTTNRELEAGNEELIGIVQLHSVPYVLSGHSDRSYVESLGGTQFVGVPASGDRTVDADQAPISYMVLGWTGQSFTWRREQFYRTNAREIEGAFLRLALAHIQPLFERHPLFLYPLTAASVLYCAAILIARSRRKRNGK